MAKIIVRNKIQNQMAVICSHRWEGDAHDWKADLAQMERHLQALPGKTEPNELLGVEGICSNIYFGAFGHMLKCDFQFHGRNRRPPKDPVNVMISLAYTFLTREMSRSLDARNLSGLWDIPNPLENLYDGIRLLGTWGMWGVSLCILSCRMR